MSYILLLPVVMLNWYWCGYSIPVVLVLVASSTSTGGFTVLTGSSYDLPILLLRLVPVV